MGFDKENFLTLTNLKIILMNDIYIIVKYKSYTNNFLICPTLTTNKITICKLLDWGTHNPFFKTLIWDQLEVELIGDPISARSALMLKTEYGKYNEFKLLIEKNDFRKRFKNKKYYF